MVHVSVYIPDLKLEKHQTRRYNSHMQNYILCLAMSTLIVASLLMAWTLTELPVLFFNFILKPLGYKKNSSLWEDLKPETTSRQELMDQITWKSGDRPHYLLADLLSCRYCLSFHLSFLITLIVAVSMGLSPWISVVGALTNPILVNILISHAK